MRRARSVPLVLLLSAGWGCYRGPWDIPSHKVAPDITRPAHGMVVAGPCADTAYQRMHRTPVDSLTAREFEEFRIRDAACLQYQAETRRAALPPSAVDAGRSNHRLWVFLVASVAASALLVVAITNAGR